MSDVICPKCGAVIPPNAAFCGICGTPAPTQQPAAPAAGSPPARWQPPANNQMAPPAANQPGAGGYPPPPPGYQPPQGPYPPQFPGIKVMGDNTKWALGLGIVAFCCCGPVTGIPGMIMAKKDMDAAASGQAPQLDASWAKNAYYLNIIALILFVIGVCLFWGRTGIRL